MKLSLPSLLLSVSFMIAPVAQAEVPAGLQAKVDAAKVALSELGKNPAVIAAIKESNSKGGMIAGMSNAKWDELSETDPAVVGIDSTATSKVLQGFASKHADINKLYLRDEKGNLVAAGTGGKTLLWNISSRPFFKPVMDGKAWSDSAVKPDPTTQVKGVAFIVPILHGSKVIGSLQSNYTAK